MKTLMLKLIILASCLFLLSVSNAFAQISYEFDFNGDGTFEGNWDLGNVGDILDVEIWLDGYDCPPSDELFGAQLYFGYAPSVLHVNDAYPNDSNHGGPFAPTFSSFVQEEPGVYFLTVANLGYVTVTDNKIKLGTIQLERIILGDTQIVAADDIGGLYTDGLISDCNLANQYPFDANATISTISFCRGLADFDQDVDGTDAFMFKRHFGRGSYENPCPLDGPAPVPKTGQTKCWGETGPIDCTGTGRDAELQKGVWWPDPRFTDNGNGSVTDNLTGLVWLKNANCFGLRTWEEALSDCNGLSAGWCGLTDGSNVGDWRLPNIRELLSLISYGHTNPALPSQHPFTNVQVGIDDWYCTSTQVAHGADWFFYVFMIYGYVESWNASSSTFYVWPVRGGH